MAAATAQSTDTSAAEEVAVVSGRVAPEWRVVAPGLNEWIRQQLEGAGVPMVARSRAQGAVQGASPGAMPEAGLAKLAQAGIPRALVVQLTLPSGADAGAAVSGGLAVDARLYGTADATLQGSARASGPTQQITSRLDTELRKLLPTLGALANAMPDSPPLSMDQLSAASRALVRLDAGAPAPAWRELEGDKTPFAVRLRSEIEAVGLATSAPLSERARLLAARGDAEAAWSLIEGQAQAALQGSQPKPALFVAAGEVLLELGRLRSSRLYFERALKLDKRQEAAALGLAEVLRVQRQSDSARRVLTYAAKLAPDAPGPLVSLAELDKADPARRTALLLRAGERAAGRGSPREALRYFHASARTDPSAAGAARERAGELHEQLGESIEALRAYSDAVDAGGNTLSRLKGLARAQRALDRIDDAEQSLLVAAGLDAQDAQVQQELGEIYAASGRTDEAVVALERATVLDPAAARPKRALARALEQQGEKERALSLRVEAETGTASDPIGLLELARLQQELGDEAAADASIARALEADELAFDTNPDLTRELAEHGNGLAAERATALGVWSEAPDIARPTTARPDGSDRFQPLVDSFADARSARRPVVLLGLREALTDRDRWREYVNPKTLDVARLEQELAGALAARFDLVESPVIEPWIEDDIEALFAFDSARSRDIETVVRVNDALETHAVFVARLQRQHASREGMERGCGQDPFLDVELRSLGGKTADNARLHSNTACLPGGMDVHGTWNVRAAAVWGALLALLVYKLVRGWGNVIVDFKLPPRSKALFSVSLSRRPRKVKDKTARRSGNSSWVFQKRLEILSRFERRLEGDRSVFRWIPGRRREYYLTVRGPLVDYHSDAVIGDFLEERTIRVRGWKTVKTEFDLCPKETAIEVKVTRGGSAVAQARVCVRGRLDTQRFAREGTAFVYVGEGEHVILAGADDRVAERAVLVETFDAFTMPFDIGDDEVCLFTDCPEAVEPYMEGDVAGAARALEAAGQPEAASRIRATWHRERGDAEAAAEEFQAAGDLVESAALLEGTDDPTTSAALYEEAGEYARAALAWQEAGDIAAAARAFEQAYDYENALECYRQLEEMEKVLELLEKRGEYFDAALEAVEAGQLDRAIHDLQQIDARHGRYSEACRALAKLLAQKGETDVAIEKYAEALELAPEALELDDHERYAKLLETAGRGREALSVYEGIRRRDLHYGDVNTRIEALKREVGQTSLGGQLTAATTPSVHAAQSTSGEPSESRYELQDELGRGGMGVVFRAQDKQLGREVAIKMLPDNLRDHPKVLELFEREARAAAALNHPNIVTVFDAGCEGDTYFMTMECLDGVPLDQILKKNGSLPARAVAGLGVQVATGLEYARQKKIVHRDIKPSNLFVTRDKIVKIMDFGLAKMVEEVRRSSTMIGGTPNFMAPEQAAGEPVDHRTDLYSLGASFFQLVTGTPPFEEGDLTYHHRNTPAPDARERKSDVPEPLALLIKKLMEKRPEDRYQTAGEVAVALQEMLGTRA